MCGIAGYYCFGKKRPEKYSLNNLLSETETRGRHSTGVSFIEDNTLRVIKAPMSGSTFIKENEDWKGVSDIPKSMIMHCRFSTKGTERDNKNNHPVHRDGMAIVHNGMINNDDALYKKFGFQRDGEVDTEIILALLESKREVDWVDRVKSMDLLSGGFAVAAIDTEQPDTLCLFKHNNPIVLGIDREDDIVYFASTEYILKESLIRNYKNICNIKKKLVFYDMKNDGGLVLGKTGVTSKFEIDPVAWSYSYPTDDYDDIYGVGSGIGGAVNHGSSSRNRRRHTNRGTNFNSSAVVGTACETCEEYYTCKKTERDLVTLATSCDSYEKLK